MLRWINNNLNIPTSKVKQGQDRFITYNIPGQILEMQFKCQSQDTSKALIAKLTELYKVAIEYYQNKNDNKYRIYRKRMVMFLQKQNIDDILRGKCVQLVTIKQQAEKKLADARIKSKGQANRLLDQLDKLQKINNKIVRNSLIEQQDQLAVRIKKRTKSNCSTRTKDEQDHQSIFSKQFDSRELMLDSIYQRQCKSKKVFI